METFLTKKDIKLDKLVSVIIPAYNHEQYIQESIKSVINQTYQNIELVVIDDGSKDSTWQKICEMKPESKERFTQIHFETKKNEGVSKTLQKLLSLATGDYLYYFSSDDIMKPEAIETLINFLESNPKYVLAVGNDDLTDTEGKTCYWDKKRNIVYDKQKALYYTFADFLQKDCHFKFTSKKFGTYGSFYCQNYIPNGFLVRTSALKKIKPDSILILGTSDGMVEKIAENLELEKPEKTIYINEVATETEMETAKRIRTTEGKHVIPVPTFEIKRDFAGYILDPLQIFKYRRNDEPYITEKSIIRPTFSYLRQIYHI